MIHPPSYSSGQGISDPVIPESIVATAGHMKAKSVHQTPAPHLFQGSMLLGVKTDRSPESFGIIHISRLGRHIEVSCPDQGLVWHEVTF